MVDADEPASPARDCSKPQRLLDAWSEGDAKKRVVEQVAKFERHEAQKRKRELEEVAEFEK